MPTLCILALVILSSGTLGLGAFGLGILGLKVFLAFGILSLGFFQPLVRRTVSTIEQSQEILCFLFFSYQHSSKKVEEEN